MKNWIKIIEPSIEEPDSLIRFTPHAGLKAGTYRFTISRSNDYANSKKDVLESTRSKFVEIKDEFILELKDRPTFINPAKKEKERK